MAVKRLPVLAAVMLTAFAAGGCGGSSAEKPEERVAASASTTLRASTSRMAFNVTTGDRTVNLNASGEGSYDYRARRGSLQFRLLSTGDDIGIFEAVTEGSVTYIRLPDSLLGAIGGGKRWLKADAGALGSQRGAAAALSQLQSSDPAQFLHYLEGATGDVKRVGDGSIRGARVTHYRGTLDLQRAASRQSGPTRAGIERAVAAAGTAKLPADVWIDGEGRLRKLVLPTERASVTVELFDFGVPVEVTVPPQNEVSDLSSPPAG